MKSLEHLAPLADLSGAWCDGDAVVSSVMEAVSFVTPALEGFFIKTIARVRATQSDPELDERAREFMREEAEHTRAHRRLNTALLGYLGAPPPGVRLVTALLNWLDRHLPLSLRIALVATLEHFAAVMSKGFLGWQGAWDFRCAYARELFSQHAREEMGHRSVAFDLWLAAPTYNRFGRSLVLAGVLLAGAAYACLAVPWILYRKLGGRLTATLSGLARFGARGLLQPAARHSLRELFLFARRDFHPRSLADETAAAIGPRQH